MLKHFLLTVSLGLAVVIPCQAGLFSHGCPHCGCSQVKKVCRIVPDVKKITETKYVVECEEVCLPGKSRHEERLVTDPACVNSQRCEIVPVPTCGRIVTKKKLKKFTTTVEQPGYKCVVETVCGQCGNACVDSACGR